MNRNIICASEKVADEELAANENGLRILSLFDGMGCGRQALKELGIKVCMYYASEIDKFAIDVAKRNHPDIVEVGDVTKWQEWQIDWRSIDLLIGGSPCQGFSFCGERLNFADERSKLIFCFFDILDHIRSVNPGIKFLLENVKMDKRCKEVIDSRMGMEGIHINSKLFSAQNRDRIYWTNLPIGTLPPGNDAVLSDIIEEDADSDSNLYLTKRHHKGFLRSYNWKPNLLNEKSRTLLASYHKQPPHCPYIPVNSRIEEERCSGFRRLSPVECERLQTLPVGYTEIGASGKRISNCQRYKMIGNGWTVAVIKHLFSSITHNCISHRSSRVYKSIHYNSVSVMG